MGGIFFPGPDTAFYKKLKIITDLFPNILMRDQQSSVFYPKLPLDLEANQIASYEEL